jgi:hypothetical protein
MAFVSCAGTVDFTGKTLVLPSVSVGNVGQLALDVLLASYAKVQKIGYFHDPFNTYPFAANDAIARKMSKFTGKDIELIVNFVRDK